MIKKAVRSEVRKRKHLRVRKKISGVASCPRLCVYRSLANIYAQIIDDESATTLVSASTMDKEIRDLGYGGNARAAALVGKLIAERALEKQIDAVVFDRGGYIYHGRIKSLAEAAREAGLKF